MGVETRGSYELYGPTLPTAASPEPAVPRSAPPPPEATEDDAERSAAVIECPRSIRPFSTARAVPPLLTPSQTRWPSMEA